MRVVDSVKETIADVSSVSPSSERMRGLDDSGLITDLFFLKVLVAFLLPFSSRAQDALVHSDERAARSEKKHVAPLVEDSPTSEPEPTRSAEPEPTAAAENWPEPGPEWETAFRTWGGTWHGHVYIFAVVFLLMTCYASYYVVQNVRDGLQKKYLGFCLNVVMFLGCFTRSFVLFFDPYHQGDLIGNWKAMHVLWSLAGPCLTSSDSLVILALLETTKISLAPPKLQKFRVIMSIIVGHFVLVLLTDFLVSEFVDAKPMLVFCQSFFISWGSLLGIGYFALAYKIDKKLFSHRTKTAKERLYIRMIYASGVANFFLAGIFIYSCAGVFSVYSNVSYVDSWSWWTLQTFLRTSEVISCLLVFSVSAKRQTIKTALRKSEGYQEDGAATDATKATDTLREMENGKPGPAQSSQETRRMSTERGQGRKLSMFSALGQSIRAKHAGRVTPSPISEDPDQAAWTGTQTESPPDPLGESFSEKTTMFTDLQKTKEDVFYLLEKQPSTHNATN